MSVIAVLAGEGEYRSIETMRQYSDDQVRAGHRVEYRTPDVLDDLPEFPESSFGDLGILEYDVSPPVLVPLLLMTVVGTPGRSVTSMP